MILKKTKDKHLDNGIKYISRDIAMNFMPIEIFLMYRPKKSNIIFKSILYILI